MSMDPRHVDALIAQGDLLCRQLKLDEGLAAFEAALALDPQNALALQNSATALHMLDRLDEAAERYERLIGLIRRDPNAGATLDYALGMTVSCRRKMCAWDGLAQLEAELIARVRTGPTAFKPFLSLMVTDDLAVQAACARRTWQGRPAAPAARPPRPPGARIRLGYLCADFREHPTAWLIAGLIERHDRTRFEVNAYSSGPDDSSPMAKRMVAAFDHFTVISRMNDDDAARLVAAEVDILIDLSGRADGSRPGVLMRRPAPVAAHYLGYPGPMGTRAIDYMIADSCVIPEGEDAYYDCAIARLPLPYQVTDDRGYDGLPAVSRAEFGLPPDAFVFCGFAQSVKLSAPVFDIWMRILARVPNSVLWLIEENRFVAANLRREAAARDIDAARLVFAPRVDHATHLARQGLADLLLDTWPCGAHTTASDVLWANIPVVTRPGASFASRVAASLVRAAGVPELITGSLTAYEDLAVELATSPARLSDVRAALAAKQKSSPLFDTSRFARNIETVYARMWDRYVSGRAPESFSL